MGQLNEDGWKGHSRQRELACTGTEAPRVFMKVTDSSWLAWNCLGLGTKSPLSYPPGNPSVLAGHHVVPSGHGTLG